MIQLDETQNSVRDDDGPKHTAKNPIKHKQNTADKVHNSDFLYIFQNERKHNEKRRGITEIRGHFWCHLQINFKAKPTDFR